MLNIVDDYSRKLLGQWVSVPTSGARVARFLDELKQIKGLPKSIVCDHGTEFTSKAIRENNVKLAFIQPGKPTQNAFVESLNGTFRHECLNQHGFRSLKEAEWEINGYTITTISDHTAHWVIYPHWHLRIKQHRMKDLIEDVIQTLGKGHPKTPQKYVSSNAMLLCFARMLSWLRRSVGRELHSL